MLREEDHVACDLDLVLEEGLGRFLRSGPRRQRGDEGGGEGVNLGVLLALRRLDEDLLQLLELSRYVVRVDDGAPVLGRAVAKLLLDQPCKTAVDRGRDVRLLRNGQVDGWRPVTFIPAPRPSTRAVAGTASTRTAVRAMATVRAASML